MKHILKQWDIVNSIFFGAPDKKRVLAGQLRMFVGRKRGYVYLPVEIVCLKILEVEGFPRLATYVNRAKSHFARSMFPHVWRGCCLA